MDLKCECGKLVGRYRDGRFYLYCKKCKKETEIKVEDLIIPDGYKEIKINKLEPKSQDR